MPAELRPRERLAREGAEHLSEADLIAILLRTGTTSETVVGLANRLLTEFKGLGGLVDATLEELKKTKGIGPAKAVELQSAIELGRRIATLPGRQAETIREADDVARLLGPRLRYRPKECLVALILNAKHQPIGEQEISVGTAEEALAHPREVFREVVRRSGCAVILVHNHPSGDPDPSRDDILMTEQMCSAGRILGIPVLDHVIIGSGVHVSMRKNSGVRFE
jgi:DNA repair protein RadC